MEDQIRIYKTKNIHPLLLFGTRGAADRVPGEHCQKIAVSNPTKAGQRITCSKTWCDRQQLWKAVITGDTVTRLIIPIRGHGKSPEEGQR